MKTEAFPLIDVAGPPRERGRQHGRLARERIVKGIEHYSSQLARLSLDSAGIAAIVRDYLPVMEEFDADYVEEMRGIAEGAGLDFESVALINARTEIVKMAERPELRQVLAGTDGCTGLVVMPEATADGRFIQAQNWDWKAECAETAIVLRVRRDDGPDLLTFTEAGGLARTGINAAGISLTANYLESERDYTQIGVPLPLIRRKVLESEHLALAMQAVYLTPKSASSNMIVGHAGGVAINFECAPDETFQVHPDNGLLVHANHWISPVALTKIQERGIRAMPDSLYRDVRVRQLLAPKIGKLTEEDVTSALLDDFQTPWSVCRPPRVGTTGVLMATVATVIMNPAEGYMSLAPLPATGASFTTYSLTDRQHIAAAE